MSDTTFEEQTINIARDKGVATVAEERQAEERVADTAPEQSPDTAREQSADTLVEQTIDTALEQGAYAAVERGADTPPEEDGELGIGQIDLATRNAEIYRKCKEGYIHAQLSREYSLSPEWIRRICEDEERKHLSPGSSEAGFVRAKMPEVLYVAVVDGNNLPHVFLCRRGEVIRQLTEDECKAELQALIQECVEKATAHTKG